MFNHFKMQFINLYFATVLWLFPWLPPRRWWNLRMISRFMKANTIGNLPLTVYVSMYAGGMAVVVQNC